MSDTLTRNGNTRLRIKKDSNIKKNPKILNKSIEQVGVGNETLFFNFVILLFSVL